MSNQAIGSPAAAPAQPAPVLPQNAPEAPPQASQPSASWGLSTLSSCCISLDDCTGNYVSAIARRVIDFISHYCQRLVDFFVGSDDAEPEEEIQGLQAEPPAYQMSAAEFLQKWEPIVPLAPGEQRFAEQGEEFVRDLRSLPENLQIQLGTNALLQCLERPERVIKLFALMVKESPANRDFLETIRSYRPLEPAEAPKEPEERYVIPREAFLKKWKNLKKPPAPPKPDAKQKVKDEYQRISADWVKDVWGVCQGLPDAIGVQITFVVQASNLGTMLLGDAQARAYLNSEDGIDRLLAARLADPAIIAIIENFRLQPENLPPD